MTRALVIMAVIAVIALVAAWWRARDGRLLRVPDSADEGHHVRRSARPFAPGELVELGARQGATVLLEFTAPGCVPCVATRQVLDELAAARSAVDVVVIDVADAIDLARTHGVLRAPTTFVIAPDGHVRARVAGVPSAAELAALLDEDLVAA